jgi:hypothetical protein
VLIPSQFSREAVILVNFVRDTFFFDIDSSILAARERGGRGWELDLDRGIVYQDLYDWSGRGLDDGSELSRRTNFIIERATFTAAGVSTLERCA